MNFQCLSIQSDHILNRTDVSFDTSNCFHLTNSQDKIVDRFPIEHLSVLIDLEKYTFNISFFAQFSLSTSNNELFVMVSFVEFDFKHLDSKAVKSRRFLCPGDSASLIFLLETIKQSSLFEQHSIDGLIPKQTRFILLTMSCSVDITVNDQHFCRVHKPSLSIKRRSN